MDRKSSRIRRSRKTRAKISELGVDRLTIFRTSRHTYAQIISGTSGKVIAVASTLNKELAKDLKYTGNTDSSERNVYRLCTG